MGKNISASVAQYFKDFSVLAKNLAAGIFTV
jgi:hypothetical protein